MIPKSLTVFTVFSQCLSLFVCFTIPYNSTTNRGMLTSNSVLYTTISAVKQSQIELNWKYLSEDSLDTIKLFTNDPDKGINPALALDVRGYRQGHYLTKVLFVDNLPGGWRKTETTRKKPSRGPHCLNYWIASYKDNQLTKKSCMSIRPTWMRDNGDRIGNIPLSKLFIPGTHNSGCYYKLSDNMHLNPVEKYVYNQDRDVWTQLVFGIRYLDIRIGYYNTSITPNSFWINHDIIKVTPLGDILNDIKQFLNAAEDEVVILDIHRFPVGFKNRKRHVQLIELLDKEIGDIALPRTYQSSLGGPTLNEIWRQKRRLIVCYAEKLSARTSEYLWDTIPQKWGNQQTIQGLKQYLETNMNPQAENANSLWAAMAELTPSTTSVLLGFLSSRKGLPGMADAVNKNLTHWYREDWCQKANIVATDYFLGNDIINVAINCNLKKK